jgi:hypothetical protein
VALTNMAATVPAILDPRVTDESWRPFGTAVPDPNGYGPDLRGRGYVEVEYLLSGRANLYDYDDAFALTVHQRNVRYTTRLLVRRPGRAQAASGCVHLEPLHPTADGDPIWRAIHPMILERGDAWVGVSHSSAVAGTLAAAFDPERYGRLELPDDGLGWDILSQVASLLRAPAGEALTGRPVEKLYLGGWSRTGTFGRTFLMDGFHARSTGVGGAAAIDGYLIGISSGAYRVGGYRPLRAGGRQLPGEDARRRTGRQSVPVIELMTELETETHKPALRDDSDSSDDPYRLYQVAGASHGPPLPGAVWPGDRQAADVGLPGKIELVEKPSNFPLAPIVRVAVDHLHRWTTEGVAPPRAARLRLGQRRPGDDPLTGGVGYELERDANGNAIGGLRSTWVDVPAAGYYPHSQPRKSPGRDAELLAYIRGHMVEFPPAKLRAMYGSAQAFVETTETRAGELVREGWLLPADVGLVRAMAIQAAETFR